MIVGDDIEYFDQTQAGLDDNHNLFKAYYLNEKELCKGEYIVKSGWTGVAKNQFIQISSNVILDWNQQSFTNVNSINQIKSKLCDYMGQSSYDLRHRCIDLRNEKRGLYLKINVCVRFKHQLPIYYRKPPKNKLCAKNRHQHKKTHIHTAYSRELWLIFTYAIWWCNSQCQIQRRW